MYVHILWLCMDSIQNQNGIYIIEYGNSLKCKRISLFERHLTDISFCFAIFYFLFSVHLMLSNVYPDFKLFFSVALSRSIYIILSDTLCAIVHPSSICVLAVKNVQNIWNEFYLVNTFTHTILDRPLAYIYEYNQCTQKTFSLWCFCSYLMQKCNQICTKTGEKKWSIVSWTFSLSLLMCVLCMNEKQTITERKKKVKYGTLTLQNNKKYVSVQCVYQFFRGIFFIHLPIY